MKENIIKTKSFQFASEIIRLYQLMVENKEFVLSKQLLRSGTSIGANVYEREAVQSKADFISKLSIASKEARETDYWLQLLKESKLINLNYDNCIASVEELKKKITSIIKTSSQNK